MSTNRNILMLITGTFSIGGGVSAVNRLVLKALSEWGSDGCNITVLNLHEPIGTGLDPFYADEKRTIFRGFHGSTLLFTIKAWKCILSRRYDLIIADYPGVASAILPLAALGLCSYTVFCFGLELSPELLNWRRKFALLCAQKRLAISPTTCLQVFERFPGLPVDVCELALDPKIACPPSTAGKASIRMYAVSGLEKPLGRQVILCVGRMWSDQRHKGQDALIEAMPEILKAFPAAQLVLAGSGDLLEELKNNAKKFSVADSVFLPGFVPNDLLSQLYEQCYVFAMPSKGEGFGLVYLEAMNWSKPCVGGKLDAAKDVIIDGKTGILLDEPHNSSQIAGAVTYLLSRPDMAKEMGAAGLQRVKDTFLFTHFCDRFYHALNWE